MRTFAEFAEATTAFPTVVFSSALAVVVLFWVLAAIGAADADGLDGAAGSGAWGWGGAPAALAFSLLALVSWLLSLAAVLGFARLGLTGTPRTLAGWGVLVAAPLAGWRLTRLLVRPLARLSPDEPPPSREDFVGRTCVIRTGRVDGEFGQAEVAARDGSTAVVQVRQTGGEPLALGGTGLLYAYEADGEFFWVASFDAF